MSRVGSLPVVAALVLVIAACTNLPAPDATRGGAQGAQEQQDESVALLVVLDQDNAIVVIDRQGEVIERYDPPPDVRYAQPIWASPNTIVSARIVIDDRRSQI